MGPPKPKPFRMTKAQQLKRYDYFEYRYDRNQRSYYMFNPYTGETMFGTDTNYMDRKKSTWAPIENHPSESTVHTTMYPEFYQCRRWGRRTFHGWTTGCLCMPWEEQLTRATTHIAAVYRGYSARQWLRRYYLIITIYDPFHPVN
jgi:hypothetical protein